MEYQVEMRVMAGRSLWVFRDKMKDDCDDETVVYRDYEIVIWICVIQFLENDLSLKNTAYDLVIHNSQEV